MERLEKKEETRKKNYQDKKSQTRSARQYLLSVFKIPCTVNHQYTKLWQLTIAHALRFSQYFDSVTFVLFRLVLHDRDKSFFMRVEIVFVLVTPSKKWLWRENDSMASGLCGSLECILSLCYNQNSSVSTTRSPPPGQWKRGSLCPSSFLVVFVRSKQVCFPDSFPVCCLPFFPFSFFFLVKQSQWNQIES